METPRILLAGTNAQAIALARQAFEPLDYQIVTAQPMSMALYLALKNLPELIISTQEMTDGDGLDFLHELLRDEELAQIPFVLCVNGAPEAHYELKVMKEGASKVISSDLSPHEFLSLVEPLIQERLIKKGKRPDTTPE